MQLAPLKKRDLPPAPKLKSVLGPSFILLGLGLGSGEIILWPYLATNYGLGIMWGALVGITFQFFLNMEIERYTLVTGESIFVGLARKLKHISPIWFIASTLIPWVWPGIIASSATILASVLGIAYTPLLPIALLLLIGLILTVGPVIYKTEESLQRMLVLIGVPFILALTIIFATPSDWKELGLGIIGKGKDFWFLPAGIPIASFLAAFAYSGAGGNLNLAQSYYVKEKGYGMGRFSGRITSILTGKKESIALEGTTFIPTHKNLKRFRLWWKRINTEHAIVFWATGAITMMFLALLAKITVGDSPAASISFVIKEAQIIGEEVKILGILFSIVVSLMLFSTQFSIADATSRIMSENLVIFSPHKFRIEKLPTFFYIFLWTQILAGIAILATGSREPLTLVIIGAVLNAFAMFVFSGLLIWLNITSLDKPVRPSRVRVLIILTAFVFYGAFGTFTILQQLIK